MSQLGIPCQKPPCGTLSAVDLKSGKRVRQMPIGTVVPLSSTPAVLISLRIAAMTSSPARYRNRSKHQVPGRGTDDWQHMRFCNLPGGATLARAYRNSACTGLPETALARACRNSVCTDLPRTTLTRTTGTALL
ncbi:hypothetical protein CRN15_20625 [Raoultella planticola]|nr:hypothetical protein CRT62_14215 [Raoultella planticola]ATM17093.1 hypothetical protein CRN15_20625 [Raoultella planticola]PHH22959.1 hypothetical protein CRX55_02305 [Raoultella planticola]